MTDLDRWGLSPSFLFVDVSSDFFDSKPELKEFDGNASPGFQKLFMSKES